jgi:hypothetical protein
MNEFEDLKEIGSLSKFRLYNAKLGDKKVLLKMNLEPIPLTIFIKDLCFLDPSFAKVCGFTLYEKRYHLVYEDEADHREKTLTLKEFIRQYKSSLHFYRDSLLLQLLDICHRINKHGLFHRNLTLDSLIVRFNEESHDIDLKLFNFNHAIHENNIETHYSLEYPRDSIFYVDFFQLQGKM